MSVEAPAVAVPSGGATIGADNPWPGLLAFRERDEGYFQGRQTETEDLFRLVMRERLTVLFGLSGLGKSSLLQAGLFPRLRREQVFPVSIRLDFSAERPDLVAQVRAAIAREATAREIEVPPVTGDDTLWEYFHRDGHNFWNARNRPVMPLLVFDQFEEIFTLGRLDPGRTEAVGALVEQIADLVEGRPPAILKAWIDEHPENATAFSFGRHHYKILLGIREDFLPDLEFLRTRMPAVGLNRLRLRPMNGDAGLLVVNQAPHLIDADVAMQVVRFVAADRRDLPLAALEVEPALLSVVCRELNNKRVMLGEPKITTALLEGSQEQVLADFYERSTADLPPEIRYFIEDRLLTVSGFRDSVALENALSIPGVSLQALDQLVERRLVRREDRGGVQRLELTHDLLTGVVRASRDSRRRKEEAEKEHLILVQIQEQQQQALLKARRNFSIAVALTLVFAGLGAAAWYKKNEADQLKTNSIVRQLAAQSAALQSEGIDLEPVVNLAIASMLRLPSLEGDRALRESAERLPGRVSSFQHGEPVSSVAFSADGRWLATASEDKTARVFDVLSGKQVSELKHGKAVASVAFSPDGRWVVTGSDDQTARVFNVLSGKQALQLKHDGGVGPVAFSPDGRWVATGSDDRTARVFDVINGRQISELKHDGGVVSVAFSPDGRQVGTGSYDGTARVFEAASGKEVFRLIHGGAVWSVIFSPDGRHLATGSTDMTARVFDAVNGKEVSHLTHNGGITSVAFSGDNHFVATGSEDKTARVFDASSGREVSRLLFRGPVESVAFSQDGRWVAAGGDDTSARLFEAASGKEVMRLTHNGAVASVVFSADGSRVATGSADGTARAFEVAGRKDTLRLTHGGAVLVTALSLDGRRVATGSNDDAAQLFDAVNGTRILRLPQEGSVGGVALSADGRRVAVGSFDMTARVFDTATGNEVSRLQHDGRVVSVAFSPDARLVVTGSWDKTARVFDAASGREVSRFQHDGTVNAATFNADARWVATAGEDNSARVFDVATGKELSRLMHDGPVSFAAFSPDGRWVATASEDTTARVFDRADGHQISPALLHQGAVRFVAFTADGRRVATGSDDRTARVFDAVSGMEISRVTLDGRVLETRFVEQGRYLLTVSLETSDHEIAVTRHLQTPQDLIRDACARLTRYFSEKEWKRYVGTEVPFRETCPKVP